MSKIFKYLIISFLFLIPFVNLPAQVTIGSNLPPNEGSLLDMKEHAADSKNTTSNKGLMLPRVKLNTANDFNVIVSDATNEDLGRHVGLSVYHIGSVTLCPGVYVWNGETWRRIQEPCITKVLCETVLVNGTFEVGVPLTSTNTITLDLDVPYLAVGGTYSVYTDTQNGMSFSGTGTLVEGIMHITLAGTGAPQSGGSKTVFTITAEFSNNDLEPKCTAEIPANVIPIPSPSILGFGSATGVYGYHLESSGSKSVAAASINFGLDSNSKVKSYPVAITYNLNVDGLTAANFLNTAAWRSDPDIIIHGYSSLVTNANTVVIDSLVNYLNRGGVLILQDEYGTGGGGTANSITYRLVNKLFPIQAASIGYQSLGSAGSVYSVTSTVDDEITNGPFGDLKGKTWGEDASTPFGLIGLPADSIEVYSYGSYINQSGNSVTTYSNYVTMFKHKRLNLFIVTDGGFNSNYRNTIGSTYGSNTTVCPFSMNANYEPIARTNWGSGGNYTVYNSQIFTNVMAWAIRVARSNNRR